MPLTAGVHRTLGLDQRPAWREIDDLAGTDAEHGVYTSLDQAGEMRVGAQPPIGHQHIPGF
jgi:hypothetical protein